MGKNFDQWNTKDDAKWDDMVLISLLQVKKERRVTILRG